MSVSRLSFLGREACGGVSSADEGMMAYRLDVVLLKAILIPIPTQYPARLPTSDVGGGASGTGGTAVLPFLKYIIEGTEAGRFSVLYNSL